MVLGTYRHGWRTALCIGVLLAVACDGLVGAGRVAAAPVVTPAWQVTDVALPSVLPTEMARKGEYTIILENIGGASSTGMVTVRDALPAGLTITGMQMEPEEGECKQEGVAEAVCEFTGVVVPSGFVVIRVGFEVTGSVGALSDVASVSGGGAAAASGGAITRTGALYERGPAAITQFEMNATGPTGEVVTQADGHPHFLTTKLLVTNQIDESLVEEIKPVDQTKDLILYMPLGMLGNVTVGESCPASLVNIYQGASECPPSSRIGTILPMLINGIFANSSDPTHEYGIYNMTPERGYPAEFGFGDETKTFFAYASVVRHDGAYMVRIETPGVPPFGNFIGLVMTVYGDIQEQGTVGGEPYTADRGAFLTDPSNCAESGAELDGSVEWNTWKEPSVVHTASSSPFAAGLEGCDLLGFSSVLSLRPETTRADAPSGDEFGLEFPQAPNDGSSLATPPLKDASVRLPLGVAISPSAAHELEACQETGPDGINIEGAESEAIGQEGLERPVAGHCPTGSSLGTVEASSPLLRETLKGHLFLAAPHCGGAEQSPCTAADAEDGALYGLFMELQAPNEGVVIKLKGKAQVNAQTGQITANFEENPQFPIGKLTVAMNRGPRAPLANPQTCGLATTESMLSSWAPGVAAVNPSDAFTVDWNGAGGACPVAVPFSPSLVAGASPLAGAVKPFSLMVKREDREGDVLSLTTTLPPGLSAYVSKVARCPEPQAATGACPSASQVGTTTVGVGSGSDPYYVTGKVYFTGPYGGAPFGLSVVVPAVAGPFNLGTVVVRVALFVNPRTAQVTAVSGKLPQILDGVPLRFRSIGVSVSGDEFTLNPTSCSQLSVTGTVTSTTGATAGVASPFAVGGCKNLPFDPVLSASTQARSTKADGTTVRVDLSYPSTGEANLAKLKLAFPQQLPVRLETLRQACRAATFEANPAACPSASNVGSAIVHTPILNEPLVGPAYLVSYGNAKFPDVVFVLQGEGVTLELDAHASISTAGVLTVTVPAIPDAPVSSFESVFPAGRYSQFTSSKTTARASASQCGENLLAPVTMVGQNGASVTSSVKLAVTGCKPTAPKVAIVKAKAMAGAVRVTVRTSRRGRLTISGVGLTTLVRKDVGAGTRKLTVALTHAGRLAARTRRKVRLTVALVVGGQSVSKQVKIAL
jgi:hypothetical protein